MILDNVQSLRSIIFDIKTSIFPTPLYPTNDNPISPFNYQFIQVKGSPSTISAWLLE